MNPNYGITNKRLDERIYQVVKPNPKKEEQKREENKTKDDKKQVQKKTSDNPTNNENEKKGQNINLYV